MFITPKDYKVLKENTKEIQTALSKKSKDDTVVRSNDQEIEMALKAIVHISKILETAYIHD